MKNISNEIIKYLDKKLIFFNFFSKKKILILASIFIISYILFYFLIDFSSQSLVAHDEGLYARRSRLLEESYNWFSSPFSTAHHKTLGSYWLIALSIRIFGNSELALRLPSIITSFICLFITYLISLKISNKKSALISIISLSSMPLWIQYSRYTSPDIPFVLCILLVILYFIKFLDTTQYINKYFYIFASGLFISIAFFVRSYMALVPLIGLSPFLIFHLFRINNIFKITFFSGLFLGFIPTILNLFYSFDIYGIDGITTLFDFARKQAIGGFDLDKTLLIPLNFVYLTFPIGILFILLFIFTIPSNNIKYPLLVYYYPFISLLILIFMSTSYPHYYLFLLPPLSILFSVNLNSYTFRFSFSKNSLQFCLFTLMIGILFSLLFLISFYNQLLVNFEYKKILLVYIISLVLIFNFIFSFRFILYSKRNKFDLIKFVYNLIIPQYICLSLLYNFGILGSPNINTKTFLNDKSISEIVNTNTIYLYSVDSKLNTLLSYYLPSSEVITSLDDLTSYNYLITSDQALLNRLKRNHGYKSIKYFDNHYLLSNVNE